MSFAIGPVLTKFALRDSAVDSYKLKAVLTTDKNCLFSYKYDLSDIVTDIDKTDIENLADDLTGQPNADNIFQSSPCFSATTIFYENQLKAAQERRMSLILSHEQVKSRALFDEEDELDIIEESIPEIILLSSPLFSKIDLIEAYEALLSYQDNEVSSLGVEAEMQRKKIRELSRPC